MNKEQKELISEASFDGKAIGLTSKMWIMKNGKVFSTGGNWHFRWAFQNKKMLEERYGISFEGISEKDEEEKVRIHLIKQGMFRLNHESRGNRVTIEGVINFFNKRVKDTIVALVMDNDESISNLSIVLFDNGVETIVKRKFANFFNIFGGEKVEKTIDMINENLYKPDEELIWDSYVDSTHSGVRGVKESIYSDLVTESSLSRIWTHVEHGKRFGIVSWARDGMNPDESQQMYFKFKDTVSKLNYGFIELIGGYGEIIKDENGKPKIGKDGEPERKIIDNENSLFIPDLQLKHAIELGSTDNGFGPQDTVLYCDGQSLGYIKTNPKENGYGEYEMFFRYKGYSPQEIVSLAKKHTKNYFSRLKKGRFSHKQWSFITVEESKKFRLCELGQIRYPKSKNNPNWKWDDYGFRIL